MAAAVNSREVKLSDLSKKIESTSRSERTHAVATLKTVAVFG
jgi:hypothetical protein